MSSRFPLFNTTPRQRDRVEATGQLGHYLCLLLRKKILLVGNNYLQFCENRKKGSKGKMESASMAHSQMMAEGAEPT